EYGNGCSIQLDATVATRRPVDARRESFVVHSGLDRSGHEKIQRRGMGIDVPAIDDLQTQLDDARGAVVLRRGQLRVHIHMRGGLIHPGCGHEECEQPSQQQAGRNQLAVFHTRLSTSAWLLARVNASAENRLVNVLIRSRSGLSTAAK